ncbi:signal-transduction protein [Corynebacterium deserti GIMN1.010]|uniref:Signal-transduction protein n=1 Tax=Corynebacterium deserti GIMN1.010 TaxID=931089 RepID=A0A0M4CI38_9CORY|nr:cyclic nucleotide-binding/CBS domain-containing protein [Corynebacterium deserti]ALC05671.1 signal-transduction protein [Corynebacterium deserti GIMN1.010]
MSVELEEIRDFLAGFEPFAQLPEKELDQLPGKMSMRYFRRGEEIIPFGKPNDYMGVIRSGAVDVLDEQGVLLDRRDAGRSFGYSTMGPENISRYSMVAVEDSLVLRLGREDFAELAARNPELNRYYSSWSKRIRAAADQLRQESSTKVLRTKLGDFKIANPISCEPHCTIKDAALKMDEHAVSSLLIQTDGELQGIITDRDMRSRVVARNLDVSLPVSEIMTENLRCATSQDLAFEAMLLMAELRIHHLPIVDDGQITGIVTSADIMRLLRHDPIYLTADLSRKNTVEELANTFQSAAEVASRFIDRGASAEEVSSLLTVAADSLARRLLTLGEQKLGTPPVPYCFVVVGSQGRKEMGLASDQDNALVLDNSYDEKDHGEYFAALSEFVCNGLDRAGQVLCPGDMMASNPEWRMTVDQWVSTFHTWITAPEPDALLHAQTFFDFRGIYGDIELAKIVHKNAVSMAKGARRLHAHLASLAARRDPPLGFFRGLVVERSGEYGQTLDIKKGGTAGIVQMARLYALATGSDAVGTRERLLAAAGHGQVSHKGSQDLLDAFEFLSATAFQHQTRLIKVGEHPNYHIDPKQLSKMDREHLRDAFSIIKDMQTALATKYPVRNI